MGKRKGHNHLKQCAFISLIKTGFKNLDIEFKFFEAHLYPQEMLKLFKVYEFAMENLLPKQFLAYNVALIKKSV